MLKTLTLALSALAATAAAQEMSCAPTRADTERLSRLEQAWRAGRADSVKGGAGEELGGLGPIADPRIGLDGPQPTPGRYQCRTIKLGSASEAMPPYVAYGWFKCRVTLTPGGDLVLEKTTGSQRPVGLVCPDDRHRARFVGVLKLGDEVRTPRYGSDAERDLIGEVRRIGKDRWRIAFPWPVYESKLDVLELRRTR
jgi:hypothetical protein